MAALLERTCFTAEGPDTAALLQSLLSNDVDAAGPGGAVYALLLTPKARVISDLELYNVGDRYVIACPPQRAGLVEQAIVRARFRRKVDLVPSAHAVVWGGGATPLATLETPAGPLQLVAEPPAGLDPPETWEIARIEAGIPVFGREFDEASMPAEAGLVPRAVSFTKGCYPGQEPVARLHYRGHANRGLRGLELSAALPEPGSPVLVGDREVGRASSPVVSPRFGPIALAVLRREVEDGDEVDVAGVQARVRPLPFAA
jgi:tRNA-modifying protein YgfZ